MSVGVLAWTLPMSLAAGVLAGALYFGAVWRSARLLVQGGRARIAVASVVSRLVLMGGLLTLASLAGAPQVLSVAVGFLVARLGMVRALGQSAP